MILLGNILLGLAQVLDILLTMALWLIIARAILSWVSPDPSNQIVRFINSATDPLLRPIQRRVPPIGGGIDISPILIIFLIYFLKQALVGTLIGYANEIRYSHVTPSVLSVSAIEV